MNGNNPTYFYSFRVEYISKEIFKKVIGGRNSETNVYRTQTYFQPTRDVPGTSSEDPLTSRGPSGDS